MKQLLSAALALCALALPSFGQVYNGSVWKRADGTTVSATVTTNTQTHVTTITFTDSMGTSSAVKATETCYGGGVMDSGKTTTTNAAGTNGGTYRAHDGVTQEKVSGVWKNLPEKVAKKDGTGGGGEGNESAPGGGVGTLPAKVSQAASPWRRCARRARGVVYIGPPSGGKGGGVGTMPA